MKKNNTSRFANAVALAAILCAAPAVASAAPCNAVSLTGFPAAISPNNVDSGDFRLGGNGADKCAALYDTNDGPKIAGAGRELEFVSGVYQAAGWGTLDAAHVLLGPEKDGGSGTSMHGILWSVTNAGAGSWSLAYSSSPLLTGTFDLLFYVKQANGAAVFLFDNETISTNGSTAGSYVINWCNGNNPGSAGGNPTNANAGGNGNAGGNRNAGGNGNVQSSDTTGCTGGTTVSHISLFVVNQDGGDTPSEVPAPGSLALLGVGALALAGRRLRARARA